MKISIGAIAGGWTRSATMAFYDAVALSSADIVYVGTTIHSPLAGLQKRDCLAVARELASSGKEVVLSVRPAGREWDAEGFHAWVEECTLPVEVGDARTLAALAGKVPLVIGQDVPCESGAALKRLAGLGATRWVTPAVCRGEVVRALSYAGDAPCEIEQPVLSPRQFSRWRCRVDDCPYEGWALHGMPGCDRNASRKGAVPDWACDLNMLRTAGVSILRVTPRDVRDVALCQTLGELVRGETSAREAYKSYAATLGHAPACMTTALHPRRRLAYPASPAVR